MNFKPNIPADTRPEAALLVALMHGDVPDGGGVPAGILGAVDPARLLAFAFQHRLTPQLRAAVEHIGVDRFPEAFVAELRANTDAIARNNLRLTSELLHVIALLWHANIRVLPIKGPALALLLHGNLAMRSFSDIDIVVEQHNALRAMAVLKEAGFQAFPAIDGRQEEIFVRFEHDRNFRRPESAVHLELHWRLFDRYIYFPLDTAEFWGGLRQGRMLGADVLAMSPEHLLLTLAVHGSKHAWAILAWSYDIERLIVAQPGLDWDRVSHDARELGAERMLHLALHLAVDLWGARLPEPVGNAVAANRAAASLAAGVIRRLLVDDRQYLDARGSHQFLMAMRERLRDRAHYLWFWTFTPNERDRAMISLAPRHAWMYRLVRPLRMLRDTIARPAVRRQASIDAR